MKKRLRVAVIALAVLTANAMFGAPEDRFKGGINDGYDKNSVLDSPIPASGPEMAMLGTNGAGIASGEAASTEKGTDFGSISWGAVLTNSFSITNSGNEALTISGVITNGAGAELFSILDLGFPIDVGGVSNFTVRFAPTNTGAYTASVQIANNSTSTPYIVYLAGTGAKQDQTITNFPNPGDQLTTNSVGLFAQASSGLEVTNFTVVSGSAVISSLTNMTFTGSGSVSVAASKAGNTNWNSAPAVTNTFNVTKTEQAALTFSPTSPQTYNTTNALSVSGGSGTGTVSYAVLTGPGQIEGLTNLAIASGTGSIEVRATKATDDMYNSIAATASVVAAKADQTVIFPVIPDQVTTNMVRLAATASSSLGVSFAVGSGPGSITGDTNLSFSATGAVGIVASQAGDDNWNPAPSMTNAFNVTAAVTPAPHSTDFGGEGCSCLAVYNPLTGQWYIWSPESGLIAWADTLGGPGYDPVPGDYDGDGRCDLAVYNAGYWYAQSLDGTEILDGEQFGGAEFRPVAGDYDGDGSTDLTVYHEDTGFWYSMTVGGSLVLWEEQWGGPGFDPVAGDYTGNGCADLAVYHQASGCWYIQTVGRGEILYGMNWGWSGFSPVAGDYDGDGIADLAVYHEASGYWFILTLDGTLILWGEAWGGPGFTPVQGDYNADGVSDLAVYYDGYWFVETVDGTLIMYSWNWGGEGYDPVGR